MRIPEFPLTGGCQCGTIRYRISAMPLTLYVCHCTTCQTQSGSAFGESLQVEQASLQVAGAPASFTRQSESTVPATCTFCPDCGTRLWHQRDNGSTVAVIKPGTLDDTSWLKPVAHIWTLNKQPWFEIHKDAVTFREQPDIVYLRQLWADQVANGT